MILAQILAHQHIAHSGVGIGCAVAVVLSWQRNKSILYAILHGVLSWIYVIYYAITRNDNDKQGD